MSRQKAATPDKALKFGDGRSVKPPVTNQESWILLSEWRAKRSQLTRALPCDKALSVVNDATFVIRTAA